MEAMEVVMKQDLAILFDLDGTVLFTDTLIQESFIRVFEKYKPGYTLTKEELLSFLGPSLEDSFKRYFDDTMINELIEYYRDFNHSHHLQYVHVYDKVEETLQYLKAKGYPLAIVTTKFKVAAYVGLDTFHLTKYFDVVIGLDDVKETKPNPEGVNLAMEALGCKKAVMIGDNITDIQAGKNANVYTIGVKWSPKGYQELAALHPDLMVDRMDEIIEFIEKVGNKYA